MSSLFDEKRAVERGLNATCLPGNKWEPIAMDWFLRWKLYADADDDRKESDLYPGPIDNSFLKGKFEDELKPGLVDKDNIVLMPCSVTNVLFAKYGGGPRFSREVVNNGSIILPHYQVSLYRVRVDAYLCDSDNLHPDVTNPERHLVRFFAKKATYKEVVDSLMRDFGLSIYTTAVRCWLRDHDDTDNTLTTMSAGSVLESTDDTTDAESSKTSPTAEISGDTKRARIGRILTTELTDKDGPWTYQRHTPQQSIQEILGNDESVHIIIEAARSRKPEDHEWPRASLLKKWKGELRVGDVVDCKDVGFGKWYNAVVKEVTPTGDVSVHYKGWAVKFDEVIPSHLVNLHIQPLYMHTVDRREWAVGDGVDFRVSPTDCTAIWLHSKIVALDEATDRVQVEYSYKEKMDAFKKYNLPLAAVSPQLASSPAVAVLDDDMVKRQQQAVASLCSPTAASSQASVNGITTPIASGATVNPSLTTPLKGGSIHSIHSNAFPSSPPADGRCREWCDLLGEDICPEHTHTKVIKPVVPLAAVNFPGQANYLGSGSSSTLTTSIGGTISNSLLSRNSPSSYQYKYTPYEEKHIKGHTDVAGAVGLQNLGNTCFMNSILQCVSNTEVLTKLFQSDDYKSQLNHDNPLGHGGKLAKAYAKLIQDMWCGAYSKIIPRDFKTTIGEFQPQFAGYDQQDSQEFLGFLLDGLHEDLNRVVKKPHVSKIESKGRPDTVIANESWRRYLLRNDSAVVDSCFGQLKSHVTCTNCGNESVTFDEYSSLSLPLPVKNTKCISMVVQLLPLGSVPVRLELEVEVTATMGQLQGLLVERLQQQGYLLSDTTSGSENDSSVGDSNGDTDVISNGAGDKSTLHNAHDSCVSMSQPETTDITDSAVEAETAHSPCSTTSTSMIVEDGHTETADSVEGSEAAYELVTHPVTINANATKANAITGTTTGASATVGIAVEQQVQVTMQDTESNGFVTIYTDTTTTANAVDDNNNSMSVSVSPTPACTDTSTSNSSRTSPALFINTTTTHVTTSTTTAATTNATTQSHTTSTTTTAAPSAESFHFHFGIPYFTKPASIDKSYNAAENANTAITSFVGRNDTLMAFQLAHKAPEFRKHYSTVSTYSSRPATVYNAADSDCGYVAVDVCMGNKVKAYSYLSSEKIELAGYPVRLALPVDCTNRYVHNKVRQIAQRYLREEVNTPDTPNSPTTPSMDTTATAVITDSTTTINTTTIDSTSLTNPAMPYSLVVTNVYGSIVRRTVPIDDSVFEVPKTGLDMLVVAWPDRFAEVMDEEQLTAVHDLEGDRSNPATPKKAGLSVYQCFDKYIEREQLAEAETLYCARCQQHLAPIKKMDLWAAPDVLVLQLKRFQYVPGQYFVHREKINNLVDFPIEGLDLSKYVIGPQNDAAPPVYDLYAVSHHSGGLGGGHYTATCKNFLNNKWYDFNDSSVSSTSPERAISPTAYVLFYKRRTGSLKWAGIEPSSVPMPDE